MKYYCLTDVGLRREKNQDSYCAVKNVNGDFLGLVCDGIGGGKAGDVASGEVVKYFINEFKKTNKFNSIDDARNFFVEAICKANRLVNKLSVKYREFAGMGTTLTGVFIGDVGCLSLNVGDSRVYGYADRKECRLTVDDTLVNNMIANGEITYEESLTHPKRHYLIKAIGIWEKVEPNVHKVRLMDDYLICSDGLYNYIDPKEMKQIMTDVSLSCDDKANMLLKKALLNGGYDNITIIVVDSIG